MAKSSERAIIVYSVLSTFLLIHIIFLAFFLKTNIWWVFPALLYFCFFIARDSYLENKEFEDKTRIKER